jgi:hypothetical protein
MLREKYLFGIGPLYFRGLSIGSADDFSGGESTAMARHTATALKTKVLEFIAPSLSLPVILNNYRCVNSLLPDPAKASAQRLARDAARGGFPLDRGIFRW